MTEWFHCNTCFRKYHQNLKFFLKECGRIECQKCLKSTGEGESNCIACVKSCKTIPLNNDLKPEIQLYFKSIPQLLDSSKKVYEFQMKNHFSLLRHMYEKYTQVKNELIKCYKVLDTYKKDISRMKTMLKHNHVSSTPGRILTSTPVQAGTSPFFDMSLSSVGNTLSTTKNSVVRPGYPLRVNISPQENQSFSPATSSEHIVPNSKQMMVPTHSKLQKQPLSSLMSQIARDSHIKVRPGRNDRPVWK